MNYVSMDVLFMNVDAGGVYETVTVAEHMSLPRADPTTGEPVKLTSNILKDGRWVGARPRLRSSSLGTA